MDLPVTPENQKQQQAVDPLLLDQQLCFPIYSLSRKITQRYQPLLKTLGLTYPQYLVMLVLWESSSVPVSHICERLMLDTGTVTPLLKRMEKQGLIARQRDDKDERRVMVTLTESGRALRADAETVPQQLLCEASISAEEVLSMRRVLNQWLQKFG